MTKAPFAATTEVSAEKSVGEICSLLVQSGARQISQEYGSDRMVKAVRFSIEVVPGLHQLFVLPVRIEACRLVLKEWRYSTTLEDARRVAWRQLFWWVKAQLAIIQTGMVQASEVFMPYMEDSQGRTLFESFVESKQKSLTAGNGDQCQENQKA